jgi:GNAT superfamily N-acetyltransferase
MAALHFTRQPDLALALPAHIAVPSVFTSHTVFDVQLAAGDWRLSERTTVLPFEKNYDLAEDPMEWLRFDTSRWVVVSAFEGEERVGGAIVAFDSPGVDMLEGRRDLAVVWDLRVAPQARRRGVARALLADAEGWAREQGCRELKVETQNTNVAACRLYMQQGFTLHEANRAAYPRYPNEVQLIWRKPVQ